MEISVLASGSSGNSTYIGTNDTSVLIDAGISLRELKRRLSAIGKDIAEIDAVLITHEHTDHTKGLERLDLKHNIPVHINKPTYNYLGFNISHPMMMDYSSFMINDISVQPVPISHDAAMPSGFRIRKGRKEFGYFTDLGYASDEIRDAVKNASALVLETNHDVDMLLNGPYPYPLKQRILGDKGHLSNIDAGLLVRDYASDNLETVFLAHLSKNNNTEDLAYETFSKLASIHKRIMTKQEENTELLKI